MPLRIGVNALYLIPRGVGGTEIYLRNLLPAIARVDSEDDFFVFTNIETGPDLIPAASNFTYVPQPVRAVSRPRRLLWEQFQLPDEAGRLRLDCLFNPGFTAPFSAPCPSVTVFHDLQHKRHPEHFRMLDLAGWRFFLYWSARKSARLIAVSETTKKDLIRYYHRQPDRIDVIGHGVEPAFLALPGRRAPEPFVLCVSTLHPHKGLDALLRAFVRFREERPGWRLVLAGMKGFHATEVEGLRLQLNLSDAVSITGWIAREELIDLYRRAGIFVYPSTFEGFGMPVLEALAAGVPVACSNIEPLRSLAGDAAVQFEPNSEEAIARAMLEAERRSAELSEAGPRRAAGHTWEEAARLTVESLRAGSSCQSSRRDI